VLRLSVAANTKISAKYHQNPYNFELYCFKVGLLFLRYSVVSLLQHSKLLM